MERIVERALPRHSNDAFLLPFFTICTSVCRNENEKTSTHTLLLSLIKSAWFEKDR